MRDFAYGGGGDRVRVVGFGGALGAFGLGAWGG